MKVGEIANAVAAFHNKERSDCVDENGQDMVISALNEARKELERDYDFFLMQGQAWLSVDPTSGALLSSAKLYDGTEPDVGDAAVSVKSVETAYLYETSTNPSPTLIPLYVDPKKLLALKTKERSYRYGSQGYPSTYPYNNFPLTRYPGVPGDVYQQRGLRGYFQGQRFYFDPSFDTARYAILDASLWLEDYLADQVIVTASSTASTALTLGAAPPANFLAGVQILGRTVASGSGTSWTLSGNASETISFSTYKNYKVPLTSASTIREQYSNWLTEHGSDYLKWHAICSLNYRFNTFVVRTQSFLSPPEKARDVAKQSLMEWDSFMWEQGRTPFSSR